MDSSRELKMHTKGGKSSYQSSCSMEGLASIPLARLGGVPDHSYGKLPLSKCGRTAFGDSRIMRGTSINSIATEVYV